jgi:hypothetical protein
LHVFRQGCYSTRRSEAGNTGTRRPTDSGSSWAME